jgi:DNA replication licensing factor MCM2
LDRKIKGEFLDENEEKDYEKMDHLDHYDLEELDEENYSDISFQAKLKAEQEIQERHNKARGFKQQNLQRNLDES